MNKRALCGITIGLLATGLSAKANLVNLVQNGSFEDGNFAPNKDTGTMQLFDGNSSAITGWTVNGGGGGTAGDIAWESGANPWGLQAYAGSKFVDLTGYYNDGINPHGGITVSQNIGTVKGATYTLTFAMGSSYFYDHNLGDPTIQVTVSGTPMTYTTTDGDVKAPDILGTHIHWQLESFTFVASVPQTTLAFLATTLGNDNVLELDDVSLTGAAVPEASTIIAGVLLLLPFGAGIFRSIRKSRIDR